MRVITAGLLAAACGFALTGSIPTASAHAHPPASAALHDGDLDELRATLERFRDPKVAERHGYERTDVCTQAAHTGPGGEYLGAMGYHYVNKSLAADPTIDPLRPEILIYVPGKNGKRVLGGVEYLRYDSDGLLSTADDRPRLFGKDFDGPFAPTTDGQPVHYSLHVWLFEHNPKGLFEPWNPRVRCPEAEPAKLRTDVTKDVKKNARAKAQARKHRSRARS
ncbi:MAG: hypothetical protein DIU60_016940 [Actinomycetes bacterium]|jgi:hypothetical protein|nr:MAG: hypothetical protein DIU60_19985 [Actinomycetota bacterium]